MPQPHTEARPATLDAVPEHTKEREREELRLKRKEDREKRLRLLLTLAPSQLPHFVTQEFAARYCGVHTRTVARWLKDGRLTATRTEKSGSGRVLIPSAGLRRLLGLAGEGA